MPDPSGPAGPGAVSRVERLLPSLADVIFIGLTCIVVFAAPLMVLTGDGDLASHIRMGERILATGGVPDTYAPTYTMAGEPFLGHAWGGEVVLALAHGAGGLAGVLVLCGIVIGLVFTLQFRLLVREGAHTYMALAATAIGAAGSALHWLGRSHLFTWYLAAALLLLLETPRTKAWWLAPLFVVWVNLHGGFFFGLMLIGLYLAAAVLEAWTGEGGSTGEVGAAPGGVRGRLAAVRADPQVRRTATFLLVAALATLVNPSGPLHHVEVLGLLGNADIIDRINEFESPDFHWSFTTPFLLVLLGTLFAAAATRRRMPLRWILVVVACTYYALYSVRNIALFMVVAWPLVVIWLVRAYPRLRSLVRTSALTVRKAAEGPTWISFAFALALALAAANEGRVGRAQVVVNGFSPEYFPIESVRAARAAGLEGPLFNEMIWGGYIVYSWPEQPVYIDGLLYTPDLLDEYLEIGNARPGWRRALEERGIRLVLVPPDSPLAEHLVGEPGWALWRCDGTAAVIARGRPGAAGDEAREEMARCEEEGEELLEQPRLME